MASGRRLKLLPLPTQSRMTGSASFSCKHLTQRKIRAAGTGFAAVRALVGPLWRAALLRVLFFYPPARQCGFISPHLKKRRARLMGVLPCGGPALARKRGRGGRAEFGAATIGRTILITSVSARPPS